MKNNLQTRSRRTTREAERGRVLTISILQAKGSPLRANKKMIKLGENVKDKVTGFAGIATGRAEYLYGTPRVLVEQQELNDEQSVVSEWFDEARLEPVSK